MNIVHPAWRYILALQANGVNPEKEGLPVECGRATWNRASKCLAKLLSVIHTNDRAQLQQLLNDNHADRVFNDLYQAYRLFKLHTYRIRLETYLLADGDIKWFAENSDIESAVLDAYITGFFDISVFTGRIDKLDYVENVQDTGEKKFKEKWIKGVEYIKWVMGFTTDVDAKNVLTSLLTNIYNRNKGLPGDADATKLCDAATKISKELTGYKGVEDLHAIWGDILSLDLKPTEYEVFPTPGEGDLEIKD